MTERALAALGDQELPRVTAGAVLELTGGFYLVRGQTDWYLLEPADCHPSGFSCECPSFRFSCAQFGTDCKHIRWLADWCRRREAARTRQPEAVA